MTGPLTSYRLTSGWSRLSAPHQFMTYYGWDRLFNSEKFVILCMAGLESIGGPVTVDALERETRLIGEVAGILETLMEQGIVEVAP